MSQGNRIVPRTPPPDEPNPPTPGELFTSILIGTTEFFDIYRFSGPVNHVVKKEILKVVKDTIITAMLKHDFPATTPLEIKSTAVVKPTDEQVEKIQKKYGLCKSDVLVHLRLVHGQTNPWVPWKYARFTKLWKGKRGIVKFLIARPIYSMSIEPNTPESALVPTGDRHVFTPRTLPHPADITTNDDTTLSSAHRLSCDATRSGERTTRTPDDTDSPSPVGTSNGAGFIIGDTARNNTPGSSRRLSNDTVVQRSAEHTTHTPDDTDSPSPVGTSNGAGFTIGDTARNNTPVSFRPFRDDAAQRSAEHTTHTPDDTDAPSPVGTSNGAGFTIEDTATNNTPVSFCPLRDDAVQRSAEHTTHTPDDTDAPSTSNGAGFIIGDTARNNTPVSSRPLSGDAMQRSAEHTTRTPATPVPELETESTAGGDTIVFATPVTQYTVRVTSSPTTHQHIPLAPKKVKENMRRQENRVKHAASAKDIRCNQVQLETMSPDASQNEQLAAADNSTISEDADANATADDWAASGAADAGGGVATSISDNAIPVTTVPGSGSGSDSLSEDDEDNGWESVVDDEDGADSDDDTGGASDNLREDDEEDVTNARSMSNGAGSTNDTPSSSHREIVDAAQHSSARITRGISNTRGIRITKVTPTRTTTRTTRSTPITDKTSNDAQKVQLALDCFRTLLRARKVDCAALLKCINGCPQVVLQIWREPAKQTCVMWKLLDLYADKHVTYTNKKKLLEALHYVLHCKYVDQVARMEVNEKCLIHHLCYHQRICVLPQNHMIQFVAALKKANPDAFTKKMGAENTEKTPLHYLCKNSPTSTVLRAVLEGHEKASTMGDELKKLPIDYLEQSKSARKTKQFLRNVTESTKRQRKR